MTIQNLKPVKKPTFPHIDRDRFRLLPIDLPTDSNDSDALPDDRLRRQGGAANFSTRTLCAAMHNKCTPDAIKRYIQAYQTSTKASELIFNDGWPALYYAAECNSGELVTLLLQAGVHATTVQTSFSIPLIAYVIIHGQIVARDTSEVLKLLLAAGYDPTTIPMDMWAKYLETPCKAPNTSIKVSDEARKSSAWCTPEIRSVLALSVHLTQRYLLHMAHGLAALRPRMLQIAEANKMTELSKLPYFLIGQRPAADLVMKRVYTHVALGNQTPLVIAFAGPSGHGKTELATAMGHLLSVKATIIDMAGCRDTWGLFGSTSGYHRSNEGSKLNNFLAANSGNRSVVFLDEFDKTNRDIRNALLAIVQDGHYQDRRNSAAVDCKQTIWIVATNFGDGVITEYYNKHLKRLDDKSRNKADLKMLQKNLKHEYRTKFGAPVTGRINLIVPFFPFTPSECAVVLHKFILAFATNIRQPVDMRPDVKRLVGHCRLSLEEDGKVCSNLVDTYYNQDLGARSLANAVKEVENDFSGEYTNIDELISEDLNMGPFQHFVVRRVKITDDLYEVGVFAHGKGGSCVKEIEIADKPDDAADEQNKGPDDSTSAGSEKLIWRVRKR